MIEKLQGFEMAGTERLSNAVLQPLMSPYIGAGQKAEPWRFDWVELCGHDVKAQARMDQYYCSATDNARFHLSMFTALEMISQLLIIFGHRYEGLETKTREAWLVDNSIRCTQPLRDPDDIQLTLQVRRIRRVNEHLYIQADYSLTDHQGGHFHGHMTGLIE